MTTPTPKPSRPAHLTEAFKNMSPAAQDRFRAGPPSTEMTDAQIDAYFAMRREARAKHGR